MGKIKSLRKDIVRAGLAFEAWGFRATYYFPESERPGSPPILKVVKNG